MNAKRAYHANVHPQNSLQAKALQKRLGKNKMIGFPQAFPAALKD